jgi:hypothetical protein
MTKTMNGHAASVASEEKPAEQFITAVVNADWDGADALYQTMADDQLKFASRVFSCLVRSHMNNQLKQAFLRYGELDVNYQAYMFEPALLAAAKHANMKALELLRQHPGVNRHIVQQGKHAWGLLDFARMSRHAHTIELATAIMAEAGPAPTQPNKPSGDPNQPVIRRKLSGIELQRPQTA